MAKYDFRIAEYGWSPSTYEDFPFAEYESGAGWEGGAGFKQYVEIGKAFAQNVLQSVEITFVIDKTAEITAGLYLYDPTFNPSDATENVLSEYPSVVDTFGAGTHKVEVSTAHAAAIGGVGAYVGAFDDETVNALIQQVQLNFQGVGTMATQNTFQITDYSNEKSSFTVTSVTANAGNLAAQQTAAAALADAVDDLTIGDLTKQQMALVILDSPSIPSNVYAQRELKWLVQYQGNTSGKIFSTEIAAPVVTDNVAPNTDLADLSSTDWAAFVTAFEAFVKSPDNGTEAVTVIGARLVGRNI